MSREALASLKYRIKQEIAHHKTWCGKECQTFLPDAYRRARLEGCSPREVQDDYDSCHAFR